MTLLITGLKKLLGREKNTDSMQDQQSPSSSTSPKGHHGRYLKAYEWIQFTSCGHSSLVATSELEDHDIESITTIDDGIALPYYCSSCVTDLRTDIPEVVLSHNQPYFPGLTTPVDFSNLQLTRQEITELQTAVNNSTLLRGTKFNNISITRFGSGLHIEVCPGRTLTKVTIII